MKGKRTVYCERTKKVPSNLAFVIFLFGSCLLGTISSLHSNLVTWDTINLTNFLACVKLWRLMLKHGRHLGEVKVDGMTNPGI